MPLAVGSRLGPYEVTGLLGAGGMGEVYRARDTKLQRDVAIKVLPEALAHDTERLARFEREARTLASLNHPHIAQIYGLEESDGIKALVLELVEGPTLADRIAEGPLSMDEALPMARQIAEALEAAHEQGIIHRDLKPANIKVRPDGAVKVLDFGLAKALDPAPSAASVTASPTITSPAMMTGVGVLLGTAAYMSPEQAKGRAADKRSDIWAFGAVLYELLTGRRAFEGDDLSETLANVLKSQPDWNALPADVPPHVRMLMQRCLAKDRRDRIAAMSVALFVMRDMASVGPAAAGELGTRRRPLWRRAVLPTAAAMLTSAVVGAVIWMVMRPSPSRVTRFAIAETGPVALVVDQVSTSVAITPDGTRIVYHGTNGLLVRAMERFEPTALTGLGVPRGPFLSPDGRRVGFADITVATLKWVDINGGPAHLICSPDGRPRGATWGDDDSIIFATAAASTGLQQVPSEGGTPKPLTTPNADRGEADHVWPHFLPGARAVLFTITSLSGGIDAAQVAVLDLRTGTAKVLFRGGSQAKYVAGGYLVYAAAGTLRAVGFDLDRLAVIGTSVPLAERVAMTSTDTAQFNIARDTGSLVHVERSTVAAARTLVWVDRQGREEPIADAGMRAYEYPRLSPDETRVAVSISTQDQNDDNIWMWEVAQKRLRRTTSKPGINQVPLWMPGGRHFVFNAREGEARSLFLQAADGTRGAERLTQNQDPVIPSSVLVDGTRLLFSRQGAGNQADIMMLTLENRTVEPLISTPFIERNGEVSPDGQWLAYQVNESGQYQIAVRPFPNVNAGIWPITEDGGSQPLWAADSKELFYRAPGGAIMSVRLERGPVWKAPVKLIDGPYYAGRGSSADARTYDLGRDKRFLLIKEDGGQPPAASVRVVLNWREELKGLVPTR